MADPKQIQIASMNEASAADTGGVSLAEVIADARKESDYLDAIGRVAGVDTSKGDVRPTSSDTTGDRISAIRRISGAKLSGSAKASAIARSEELIGNAQAGLIEATRRVSGTSIAIIEANQMSGHKGKKQVELTVKSGKGEDKRDFGLGDVEWHQLSQDEILSRLETRIGGLTSEEGERLLLKYGYNRITPPPDRKRVV